MLHLHLVSFSSALILLVVFMVEMGSALVAQAKDKNYFIHESSENCCCGHPPVFSPLSLALCYFVVELLLVCKVLKLQETEDQLSQSHLHFCPR